MTGKLMQNKMAHNRIQFHNPAVVELKDGKKTLALNKTSYQRNIDQFKVGEKVAVTIDNERVTASDQQRRYLFGVCYSIMGEYTGHDKEELHDWAMREHFGTKKVKVGKIEKEVRRSWTTLNKSEGVEFIDWLIGFASIELGCVIPSPEEAGYISNSKPMR